MRHYTHFTTEEREKSRVLKAQRTEHSAIARELGRAPSSVSVNSKETAMPKVTTQHIMQIDYTGNGEKTAVERQNCWMMQYAIMSWKR